MQPPALRSFWWALGIGYVLLSLAAWKYAAVLRVPAWIALPLACSFLIEFSFYLACGWEAVRERLRRGPAQVRALWIAASGLLPYLIYTVATGQAVAWKLAAVAGLFLTVSFWYVLLPKRLLVDLGFLAILAAAILSGLLRILYIAPLPKLRLEVLGHIGLIHTAVFAIFLIRGMEPVGLGFVPTVREMLAGLKFSVLFCLAGLPAAWALGLVRIPHQSPPVWRVLGTLMGVFWIVAFSEEFFFRGLLQNWLRRGVFSSTWAWIFAAICFGLAHLSYARAFPNWRMAAVAFLAGLFYGQAFRATGSVRASMVAHAVVVTLWKSLGG